MPIAFHPLDLTTLTEALHFAKPEQFLSDRVEPTHPAMDVMTDLSRVSAATIAVDENIDNALQTMIDSGVRLLLVINHEGYVSGLITATDIQGAKPMKLVQETGVHHSDILVEDIMTPIKKVEAIDMDTVRHSQVGDIVQTLTQVGRQHALVVERKDGNTIRGIFSATQIGRQLGMSIKPDARARTFAELEMAIAS